MTSLLSSFRTAVRGLRHDPGFFLIAVFTLAVGIGANAALFTVVHSVLLQPLPYPEPERIVGVWHTAPGLSLPRFELSNATYLLYRGAARSLEDLGIYWDESVTLTGDGREPERVKASGATASVFSILRVPPALGRAIQAADEQPHAEPVVVLSRDLWRRRFGGDPNVVGSTLRVDGVLRRIVGIMPDRFQFPSAETRLWVPVTLDPATLQAGDFSYRGVARLRPDASPERAARELSGLVGRIPDLPGSELTPETIRNSGFSVLVHPLRDDVVGSVEQILWLLLGSVGLILAIACANVANLFLVRAEGRLREVAVRSALGASRWDITRLFLAESLALSLLGGALGLALAAAGVRMLVALGPEGLPRLEEIAVDGPVLAFTVAVTVLAGLLVGLFAALRCGRLALVPALKEGGRGGTAGRERLRARNALVIVQVALALILLVGAGLMVNSFWHLLRVDPGLDPRGILTVRLDLPENEYTDAASTVRLVTQLLERVRAIPGVQSAGMIDQLPLAGSGSSSGHTIEGLSLPPGAMPLLLATRLVSPGYFEALHVPLREGRSFDRLDPARAGTEVVVSEALARRFWPGQSALGKRLSPGIDTTAPCWYTVAGVVGNVRDVGLEKDPSATVYYPMRLRFTAGGEDTAPRSITLVVRGAVQPLSLAQPVREAVWSVAPSLPLSSVRPMTEVVERSIVRTTFTMLLLVIAAGVALVLGTVGIYGVISYTVSQRTREIGVRLALGAKQQDIVRMILREGFLLTLAGIAAGLLVAFVTTRLMAALLFGVSPTDPLTFAVVPLLLALVALFASLVPAQRAAAVPPLESIRSE
ncbi:MAG TPA: ABC transporter permease [Thermoanaerobaculia bacterium]|nr:ABC transporter permease [Thermoanaerobaculia bacterium]